MSAATNTKKKSGDAVTDYGLLECLVSVGLTPPLDVDDTAWVTEGAASAHTRAQRIKERKAITGHDGAELYEDTVHAFVFFLLGAYRDAVHEMNTFEWAKGNVAAVDQWMALRAKLPQVLLTEYNLSTTMSQFASLPSTTKDWFTVMADAAIAAEDLNAEHTPEAHGFAMARAHLLWVTTAVDVDGVRATVTPIAAAAAATGAGVAAATSMTPHRPLWNTLPPPPPHAAATAAFVSPIKKSPSHAVVNDWLASFLASLSWEKSSELTPWAATSLVGLPHIVYDEEIVVPSSSSSSPSFTFSHAVPAQLPAAASAVVLDPAQEGALVHALRDTAHVNPLTSLRYLPTRLAEAAHNAQAMTLIPLHAQRHFILAVHDWHPTGMTRRLRVFDSLLSRKSKSNPPLTAAANVLSELLRVPGHPEPIAGAPRQTNGTECGVMVCVAAVYAVARLINCMPSYDKMQEECGVTRNADPLVPLRKLIFETLRHKGRPLVGVLTRHWRQRVWMELEAAKRPPVEHEFAARFSDATRKKW